jgi:hypothetical protein
MTDIRELLHSATPLVDNLDVDMVRRAAQGRRNRRIAIAVAVAVVLVAGTGGTVALTRSEHHGPRHLVVEEPTSTVPSFDTSSTGLEVLPSPALSPRGAEALVWTGTKLVVWGGDANTGTPGPDRVRNDGAVYTPAARTWTPMAASPLPATVEQQAVGVDTVDGVVFARGRATAIWYPATNTWRRLGDAPQPVTDMTFTGSVVVSYSADATLDLASGGWRALPAVPAQLQRATLTWTGQELVVIGGSGAPFTSATAIALDLTRREWRYLAAPPPDVHAEALTATWDGRRVVVVNYDMKAIAYNPTSDVWSTLPDVPARFYEWTPTARSVDGYTVVFMAQAVVVLTPNDTWVPLPYGAIPFGVIASGYPALDPQPGGRVLFVLGVRNGTNVLVAADPARLTATGTRLQVGVGSVQMPWQYRLNAAHYDTTSGAVDIRLAGPNDATCTVTSNYTNQASPNYTGLTQDSLKNDGVTKTWYRNPKSTEWRTALTTDSYDVECSDPSPALMLAASASFKYAS